MTIIYPFVTFTKIKMPTLVRLRNTRATAKKEASLKHLLSRYYSFEPSHLAIMRTMDSQIIDSNGSISMIKCDCGKYVRILQISGNRVRFHCRHEQDTSNIDYVWDMHTNKIIHSEGLLLAGEKIIEFHEKYLNLLDMDGKRERVILNLQADQVIICLSIALKCEKIVYRTYQPSTTSMIDLPSKLFYKIDNRFFDVVECFFDKYILAVKTVMGVTTLFIWTLPNTKHVELIVPGMRYSLDTHFSMLSETEVSLAFYPKALFIINPADQTIIRDDRFNNVGDCNLISIHPPILILCGWEKYFYVWYRATDKIVRIETIYGTHRARSMTDQLFTILSTNGKTYFWDIPTMTQIYEMGGDVVDFQTSEDKQTCLCHTQTALEAHLIKDIHSLVHSYIM